MQCIVIKSDEFEIRPTLYISFKSWLCCCSLPTVAPQQLEMKAYKSSEALQQKI